MNQEHLLVFKEGMNMRSKREMFLMKVDAGLIESPYTEEEMERILYPIGNLKYDKECIRCHTKFMLVTNDGYECVYCGLWAKSITHFKPIII